MAEPFPLLNFEKGMVTDRDPITAPQDSFRELLNCRVFRGRLEKRKGYEYFSVLGDPVSEALGTPALQDFGGTCTEIPVLAHEGSLSLYWVTFDDGTYTVTDLNGDGDLCWTGGPGHDDGKVGEIDYDTGVYTVNWPIVPSSPITLDYEHLRQLPVVGLDGYFPQQGGEYLMAFDTRAMWQYNALEERFYKVSTDLWNGVEEALADGTKTSADFIWVEVYGELLVIMNGIDPVYYYDVATSTIDTLDSDWNGSGDELDCALLGVLYKGRMVFLRTQEDGSNYPQRARWTEVNGDLTGVGGCAFLPKGYADCPTTDWIVSCAFLGDSLYVFFERSVWELEYTGDPLAPFSWKQVALTEGSFAKMATVDFSDELITQSAVGLISTDGVDVEDAIKEIPDFTLGWNPLKIHYGFGVVVEEERAVMWTGVPLVEETVGDVLAMQYEEGAFYRLDFPFLVYGYFYRGSDLIWDDLNMDWDEADFSWDQREIVAGWPTVIAGSRTGEIYTINVGSSDDGEPIKMLAESQRIRPYPMERARCTVLDIIADGALGSITAKVYRDTETLPARTFSIALPQSIRSEKVHKTFRVNLEGAFFRFKFEQNEDTDIKIDAIVPWFEKTNTPMRPMGHLKGV